MLEDCSVGVATAVFANGLYAALGENLLYVGCESVPRGPINVRTRGLPRTARAGMAIEIATLEMTVWHADPMRRWTTGSLDAGLSALGLFLSRTNCDAGLMSLIRDPRNPGVISAVADRAHPAMAVLADWVTGDRDDAARVKEAVSRLIGLGPGLTPSGDDFLVGMLVTLKALQQDRLHNSLASIIGDIAPGQTSPISEAHLRAAVSGLASEALHDAVSEIAAGGERLRPALDELTSIGHSSGWDSLAGAVTAMEGVIARSRRLSTTVAFT